MTNYDKLVHERFGDVLDGRAYIAEEIDAVTAWNRTVEGDKNGLTFGAISLSNGKTLWVTVLERSNPAAELSEFLFDFSQLNPDEQEEVLTEIKKTNYDSMADLISFVLAKALD